MQRKVITYIMLLLFAASTTSLPVTLTMCKMDGNELSGSCGMMSEVMHRSAENCTNEKNIKTCGMSIQSNYDCCSSKTIEYSIKDNYITHENTSKKLPVHKYIWTDFYTMPEYNINRTDEAVSPDIPPGLFSSGRLYIINSAILI